MKLLDRELFNQFLDVKTFSLNAVDTSTNEPVADAIVLYNIVLKKILEQGVQFSSPGNSPQRHFILWYNAQVDKTEHYFHPIEIKEKHFNLIVEIINNINSEK
jgi:hypothetical protein